LASGSSCASITTGANPCIASGAIEFSCPAGNYKPSTKPYLVSASILCRPCAVADVAHDQDERAGEFRGRITWGPNMFGGVVNETFIDGYKVGVVDSCGLPLDVPGGVNFKYMPKRGLEGGCCSFETYSITWSLMLPRGYSHFMVVPYSDKWGEQDAGPLIRIEDSDGSSVGVTVPPTSARPVGGLSAAFPGVRNAFCQALVLLAAMATV